MPHTDPIETHVGAMLAEATRLHKEALTYLDKPKADPLPLLAAPPRPSTVGNAAKTQPLMG